MWTCVNICQMQRGTSQTNRVLSLRISLNIISSLASVHLQDLSVYTYNYFNTQTFMYWTQDRYSSSKLWKWIYAANLKSHTLNSLITATCSSYRLEHRCSVNMTVKTKINSQLTALLRFYFHYIIIYFSLGLRNQ
jgi:hypothetical protein